MSLADVAADIEPGEIARRIAFARLGLGGTAVATPGVFRFGFRSRHLSEDARLALRMVGARDIVLGLGLLLAERRGPEAQRGWLEAGGAADGIDAYAMWRSRALQPAVRVLSGAVAAGAGVLAMWAARRLTG